MCPTCGSVMADVTETWHTMAQAEGAEYLASYVTIRQCPVCATVTGAAGDEIEWVMEPEEPAREESGG